MKLKLNEQGFAVVQDGKPVYVDDKGVEIAFDVVGTVATISRLNGEARDHRVAKEEAQKQLKSFEGITDPAAAIKAMQVVANLDSKKLVDAGEVETVRQAAIKAVKAEFEPIVAERDTLKGQLYQEKIGGAFARSPLIVGDKAKLAIPADLVQARFGRHFEIVDGKVQAKDASGNVIYSRANPGAPAEFDEALGILVEQYPHKDTILKGTGSSGSGSSSGSGGGSGGKRTVTRAQFDAQTPQEKATTAAAAAKGELVISD